MTVPFLISVFIGLSTGAASVLEPPGNRYLLVRIKLDAVAAVRLEISEEAVLGAAKREIGHRRRDADVDADHRGRGVLRELANRLAARREDPRRISRGMPLP